MENVKGFEDSETHGAFLTCLSSRNYVVRQFLLSPDQFGIPNSRLRFFLIATRAGTLPGDDGVMNFVPTLPPVSETSPEVADSITPSGKLTPHSSVWKCSTLQPIRNFVDPALRETDNHRSLLLKESVGGLSLASCNHSCAACLPFWWSS